VPNRFKHCCAFASLLLTAMVTACSHTPKTVTSTWNPKAAATYLDAREATWMGWPGAARDHDTFCVSCHTVVPYVLSRSVLRPALAEQGQSEDEQKILENVTKRVRLWSQTGPYYSNREYDNAKTSESRGTEAVLNALVLACNDAHAGKLSEITRSAFASMWATQLTDGDSKGAWPWLRFGMEPWEANDSQYYGAALAAIAVGMAPEDYRSSPEIKNNLKLMRDYLNSKYPSQSVVNHVTFLWASTKVPGLVDSKRQQEIIQEVTSAQQADGGWELSSLAWPSGWSLRSIVRKRLRSDWTRQDSQSDGYATGLITFVLQEAGMPTENATVKRGLEWLASHQDSTDGSWPSVSLTQRRSPSSNVGHFMRDAATAYAVLALTESNKTTKHQFDANNFPLNRPIAPNARLDVARHGN
jgi:squalene-hopene/tetraprenyl-beta-curcumene cyclase